MTSTNLIPPGHLRLTSKEIRNLRLKFGKTRKFITIFNAIKEKSSTIPASFPTLNAEETSVNSIVEVMIRSLSKYSLCVVFILFFAVFLKGCENRMEHLPLTDEEKRDLADITKFNATKGKGGWVLKNRNVEEMNLTGIELHGAMLENVLLVDVDFSAAKINSSKLIQAELK